jgi:hypothetical protein
MPVVLFWQNKAQRHSPTQVVDFHDNSGKFHIVFLADGINSHCSQSANAMMREKFSGQPPVWCIHDRTMFVAHSIKPNQTQSSYFGKWPPQPDLLAAGEGKVGGRFLIADRCPAGSVGRNHGQRQTVLPLLRQERFSPRISCSLQSSAGAGSCRLPEIFASPVHGRS